MVLLNLQYTLLSLCWSHVFQRVPEHVAAQTLAQSRLRAPTAAGDTQQAIQTTKSLVRNQHMFLTARMAASLSKLASSAPE